MNKYILKDKKPVIEDNLLKWGDWFEKAERSVATDTIGDVTISTVFLGLDHGFGSRNNPVLFETMIFGGIHDQYQERYCTWDQAEEGHKVAVDIVKKERNNALQ